MVDHDIAAREARILAVINEVKGLGGEPYQSAAEGQIGYRKPVQEDTAPMLTAIARMSRPKRMLEFGTAYGLSGLQLGMGAPNAPLDTLEFDSEVARQAQGFFDKAGMKAKVHTDTEGFLKSLTRGVDYYDLVIFDHDKEQYLPHLKAVEDYLKPGAVILMDNVTDKIERCGDAVEYAKSKWGGIVINTSAGLYYGRT